MATLSSVTQRSLSSPKRRHLMHHRLMAIMHRAHCALSFGIFLWVNSHNIHYTWHEVVWRTHKDEDVLSHYVVLLASSDSTGLTKYCRGKIRGHDRDISRATIITVILNNIELKKKKKGICLNKRGTRVVSSQDATTVFVWAIPTLHFHVHRPYL